MKNPSLFNVQYSLFSIKSSLCLSAFVAKCFKVPQLQMVFYF